MIIAKDIDEIIKNEGKNLNKIKNRAVNSVFDYLQKNDISQEYTTYELIELSEGILYRLFKS